MADVEGLDDVLRKLRQLPEKIGNRAIRRALRKGANVVRDAARANAQRIDDPLTRERISKNIAVAGGGAKREKRAGGPMMRVGVMGGAKPTSGDNGAPGGNTTHWRFIELGTSQARAQPFLVPAAMNNVGAAFEATAKAATVEVDKELAKLT
jgi:HK97 gp10 family phage protein